jgi:hypothetical protein
LYTFDGSADRNKKCGEPRSKSSIFEVVQHHIELACEGNEAELKKSYTVSGVKDKYTEYWTNDILSQFKKAVERGESKPQVTAALKQWVKDHSDDIYSPFLTTDGMIYLGILDFQLTGIVSHRLRSSPRHTH